MATGTRFPTSDKDCRADRPASRAIRRPATRLQRVLAAALALGLGLGPLLATPATAAPKVRTVTVVETRREHNARVFASAWEWVNSHYHDAAFNGIDWQAAREAHQPDALAATDEEELYAALTRMVAGIGDLHTRVLSPREVRAQGNTQRTLLGFVSRPAPDSPERWTIVGVMPGSPAAGAGVKPGWTLDACDGLPPAEVLGTGRPLEAGRAVHCVFLDETDQPRSLTLAAGEVDSRIVRESRPLAGGAHYLRFDEFDAGSAAWLREQFRAAAGASAVVLDLRFNPGGEVAVLEEIAGDLFDGAVALGTLVPRDGEAEPVTARRAEDAVAVRARLAVLVSGESMSCAEILAAAVQHHGRGIVVGARTAGMVLGTVGIPLPGGGELQLSVWDYRTPEGARLERIGVQPDVLLEGHMSDPRTDLTAGIEAALAALAAAK